MSEPTWQVDLTYPTGFGLLTDVAKVNVVSLAWELNQPDEAVISFPKYSTDAVHFKELREVRIIDLLTDEPKARFWGPMLNFDTDGTRGEVGVNARGPLWYFTRLDLDAEPLERLTNPSFEDSGGSLDGWTAVGVEHDVSTDQHIRGDYSAILTQASAGVDTLLYQTWEETATGVGTLLTAAAYFWISPTDWIGPAFGQRGMQLAAYDPDTGDLLDISDVPITDTTPRGKWVRYETTLQLPPGVTWRIQLSLYAIGGIIYWDDATVVLMGSVTTAALSDDVAIGADAAAFMELIVGFEQGEGNPGTPKPDLNIGTDCPDCGLIVVRSYQWVEHHPCWDYIEEMADRSDGFDSSVDIEKDGDDYVRTYRTYAPQKGTDKSADIVLSRYVRSTQTGNILTYGMSTDGSLAETWDTYQGDGDGPDRNQAIARDQSVIEDVVLQRVLQAPRGASLDGLDALATKRIARYRSPAKMFRPVLIPAMIDQIVVGDLVAIDFTDGWVALDGKWRVLRIDLDGRTRRLTPTLDRVGDL